MRRLAATIGSIVANGSKQLRELLSLPTVAALVGVALSVVGLHMLFPPLAFIVPGVLLVVGALWLALPAKRRRE